MPIYLTPSTEQQRTAIAALRFIVDTAETVESYMVDYTTPAEGAHNILVVDRDFLGRERVADVLRVLAELDAIVQGGWEWSLMEAVTPEAALRADTVERARVLADAIREALGHPARPSTDTGEIVEDEVDDAPAAPRPAVSRNLPAGEVEADPYLVNPARVIEDGAAL